MDFAKMQDFMKRLYDQAQQAQQTGNLKLVAEYKKLIDQTMERVQPVMSGPRAVVAASGGLTPLNDRDQGVVPYGPQNGPIQPQATPVGEYLAGPEGQQNSASASGKPSPFSESLTQEGMMGAPGRSPKPIVDPVAELRAQQQDPTVQFGGTPPQGPQQATQNGSWMDAIFPNRPAPNLNYMTQPGGAEAFGNKLGNTKPSDLKDMASAAWRVNNYVNPVTRFAQGTYDLASGPLLGNLAADKPMSEWFSSPKPPAPAVAPTAAHGEMPPEVQAATPTAKEDNQKLDLAAATAGLPEPKPAKQGGWGLADLFGLLLGGRNFLHYKQAEEEAQKGRDFSAEQYDKRRAGEVEDLTKTLGSREQALGVEYAKAMAALKQKADNEENVDARAALRAGSTPGSPVNVKQAQAILDEARRARAIQQKKNQE